MTPWTAADDARLRHLVEQGHDSEQLVDAMGRSIYVVRRRLRHLGIQIVRNAAHSARMAAKISASYTPERRAAYAERMRQKRLWEAGHAVIDATPALKESARVRMRAIGARERLLWCPQHRQDEYRALARKLPAAEARAMIEASLTRFERQLVAVRTGRAILAEKWAA